MVQLALDSLRYWVDEFHVDGFRFDLAVSLGRNGPTTSIPGTRSWWPSAPTPVLSGTKLIAEPWDVGYGGWQTGHFPPGWIDWNDRFRDTVRDLLARRPGRRRPPAGRAGPWPGWPTPGRVRRAVRGSGRGPAGLAQLRHRP